MSIVAVVDCGMGNLRSVISGIHRAAPEANAMITSSGPDIAAADKIVLPGDGHFDACMREIDSRGLRAPLEKAAREKPFLGVCVGMQALFAGSEEGKSPGLGVLPGIVRRLPEGDGRKIPHMGWNTARRRRQHTLIAAAPDETRFYFIHSYYAPIGEKTLMTTVYGVEFSAVVGGDLLLATQFHPEKSGDMGIRLLESFIRA